jgi:serine protease AprX
MRRGLSIRASFYRRLAPAIAAFTLVVAATTAGSQAADAPALSVGKPSAYVPADLLAQAQASPSQTFAVILQGSAGHGASAVAEQVTAASRDGQAVGVKRQLATVAGAAAELTGRQLLVLARMPGIAAITPDAPVRLSGGILGASTLSSGTLASASGGFSSSQQWPFVSGVAKGWPSVTNGKLGPLPSIAVVDSGIEAARPDFSNGARVVKQVTMTSLSGNSVGDGYGHGTFVAGIAAGSATKYSGAAPSANLVSIDVMDDQGMALTSDVIAAADWIVQNKDAYNIRVANFSLHSTAPASVFWDPLDRAVEKLWFDGVVVVTAAGNYGVNGQPSGVLFAPGNDPFVITVGADDISGSVSTNDDAAAPWSSYGYTYDGFAKPEIAAPGRFMVGPVPASSTLATTRPTAVVSPGYMELSGTSFAAPVVSGAAAYLLGLHPGWTPDQVKGALMLTANPSGAAAPLSEGVGVVNAAAAAAVVSPPNPNTALDSFVVADPSGGSIPLFDAASWGSAARANASWGSASWGSASWGSASWGSASWGSASWSSASWGTASWGSASWGSSSLASASWGSASWGSLAMADNANSDAGSPPLLDLANELAAEAALGITIGPDGSVTDAG